MTNYEWLTTMSLEDYVNFYRAKCDNGNCPCHETCEAMNKKQCENTLLKFLNSPITVNGMSISNNSRNEFSNIPGIRFDKASHNWEAHIRVNNVEYQLGYHGKGEVGLLSAISARKEADRILTENPDGFFDWFTETYPDYTPIDRKARGYSH